MRRLYRQAVSLFVLITFSVMNLGAYGFSSKWISHELDHAVAFASADHVHEVQDASSNTPQPLSDSEHHLLHALGHCQPGPHLSLEPYRASPLRLTLFMPELHAMRSTDPRYSFRPPRSTSLI